jgi:hypothetical protein
MADEKLKTVEGISTASVKEQLDASGPGTKIVGLDDMVQFKVAYPKDYKKTKHFEEGAIITVHAETAATFESIGIGKIVK